MLFGVSSAPDSPRRLRLRYPAVCASCGMALSKGSEAFWDAASKKATCLACAPDSTALPTGSAGASAVAEGERRKEKRVADVRRRYGDYAAIVAEEMARRDTEASWGKGGEGENRLAAFVARELGDSAIPLHDRQIPGTRSNIDHLFVATTGVWVVDSKSYKGKLSKREIGPIWRRDNEVYIGGRNRSSLAKGLAKQVDAVSAALKPDPDLEGIHVHAALCFLDSEWGLLEFPFQVGNVWVLHPGALRKRLKKSGKLSREVMQRIARRLDLSFPLAATAASNAQR